MNPETYCSYEIMNHGPLQVHTLPPVWEPAERLEQFRFLCRKEWARCQSGSVRSGNHGVLFVYHEMLWELRMPMNASDGGPMLCSHGPGTYFWTILCADGSAWWEDLQVFKRFRDVEEFLTMPGLFTNP